MIVRVLMLEGIEPDEIGDEDRLFGGGSGVGSDAAPGGLGLDSVDALELAIHIEEEHGVKMPDDARAREAFASVASLARYIRAHR